MANIPGQNLLKMALSMIQKQKILYYKALGRQLNDVGEYVTTFASAQIIYGSFQPVPKNIMREQGLDMQKNYFTFYALNDLIDLNRDVTADQLSFNNELFQVESNTEWFALDGWKGILCVRIDLNTFQDTIFGFNTNPPTNDYVNFDNGNFIK